MSQHLAWLIIIVNPKSVLPAPGRAHRAQQGSATRRLLTALHARRVSRSKSVPVCGPDPQTVTGSLDRVFRQEPVPCIRTPHPREPGLPPSAKIVGIITCFKLKVTTDHHGATGLADPGPRLVCLGA